MSGAAARTGKLGIKRKEMNTKYYRMLHDSNEA